MKKSDRYSLNGVAGPQEVEIVWVNSNMVSVRYLNEKVYGNKAYNVLDIEYFKKNSSFIGGEQEEIPALIEEDSSKINEEEADSMGKTTGHKAVGEVVETPKEEAVKPAKAAKAAKPVAEPKKVLAALKAGQKVKYVGRNDALKGAEGEVVKMVHEKWYIVKIKDKNVGASRKNLEVI
jgi:hypothetical protein